MQRYGLACLLKHGNSNVPRDAGKIVEKLIKRFPSLKIVEQILHRHAGAREYRHAPLDLGINEDHGLSHSEIIRRAYFAVVKRIFIVCPDAAGGSEHQHMALLRADDRSVRY